MKKSLLLVPLLVAGLHGQTTIERTELSDREVAGRGDREFTLGGSGTATKDFDDSFGGASFAFGYYFTDTTELLLRQTLNYDHPDQGDDSWSGWSRVALDQHFGSGRFRPYLGVNAGRLYGDHVADAWSAGLEGGAKFYVRSRTFLQAGAEYSWLFDQADEVEDRFDDGAWNWSLALGFNF